MKKKAWIIALTLAVLGVVGYFLFGFVRGSCGENLRWTFNRFTGHLSIRGSGDMTADFEQAWCEIREDVRSVSLPDGLTSIGNGAFDFCRRLTSVTIPEGVRSIGDMAFKECYALADLTLPKSLTSIGFAAFRYCTALRCVKIPESVRSIEAEAFSDCEFLTDLTLPEGLRSIGEEAFQHCHDLTDVTIPDSVTEIGEDAFSCCEFTVFGEAGSAAETYARENGIDFRAN